MSRPLNVAIYLTRGKNGLGWKIVYAKQCSTGVHPAWEAAPSQDEFFKIWLPEKYKDNKDV